jgi:hypothetical protein
MPGFILFLKVWYIISSIANGGQRCGGNSNGIYEQRYAKTKPADCSLRDSVSGYHKFSSHNSPPPLDVVKRAD